MDNNNKITKLDLFLNQKKTLDTLLEHKAISQAQHDYSLGCLRDKMGINDKDELIENNK